MGEEKLGELASARLRSLLELGDPEGEVVISYRIKKRLRDFFRSHDPGGTRTLLREFLEHCASRAMPPEIQRSRATIETWFNRI